MVFEMRKNKKKRKISFFKDTLILLRDSFTSFNNDNVLKMSASLAYYTVFSLVPILIVIIGICSIFYGQEAVQGQIFAHIAHIVGAENALQIQEIMRKTTLYHDNFLATAVG